MQFPNILGTLLPDYTQCSLCHKMTNHRFGSDIHIYGQAMWNARERGCVGIIDGWVWDRKQKIFNLPICSNYSSLVDWNRDLHGISKKKARAAATQLIFSRIRPSIYAAAQDTSVHKLFQNKDHTNVCVQIRWGDKAQEMEKAGGLQPIEKYIDSVSALVRNTTQPINVFVMTESFNAIKAFQRRAPKKWNILTYEPAVDPRTRQTTSEHMLHPVDNARAFPDAGWHSIIALVIAMQLRKFVITSGSNWGRLIEELCYGNEACSIIDTTPSRPNDWR